MSGDPWAEFAKAAHELKVAVWTPIEELLTRVLRWMVRS